jgi:precorrin-6B methylase 2
MIYTLLIIAGSITVAVWMIYTVLSLAPWLPTRAHDMRRIGELALLRDGEVFYDLGSGDGRVVCALARLYPRVQFVGVEMSFLLHALASLRKTFSRSDNVRLTRANLFTQKYEDVDVIYIFGVKRTVNSTRFKGVIEKLAPGSRIVLYNFALDSWEGDHKRDIQQGKTPINIYTVKSKK